LRVIVATITVVATTTPTTTQVAKETQELKPKKNLLLSTLSDKKQFF
jgi:hypothetical protein